MNDHEFEYWQAVTQSSKYRWREDEITRLNGNGTLFYTGGEDGMYLKLSPKNKITVGHYEGAFPHIGEAIFQCEVEHQCKDYNEAFQMLLQIGGTELLTDMFTCNDVTQTLVDPEEQGSGGFEMKM